jgi:hypothetical protein
LVLWKNEANVVRLRGNSSNFAVLELNGFVFRIASAGLELSKLVACFVELTREARAVERRLATVRMVGSGSAWCSGWLASEKDTGFGKRNALEAPGGVCNFLDEIRFRRGGGLIFCPELAAV